MDIILYFTKTTIGGVFMINLSIKERMLLEDEKSHEQLCVDKYNEYSNKAYCPELKNLFSQLAQKEQQHLDSINQLLNSNIAVLYVADINFSVDSESLQSILSCSL